MREIIGQLAEEWLSKYREIHAMIHIYRNLSESYTKEEINTNFYRLIALKERLIEHFEIDDTRDWNISINSGIMYYLDNTNKEDDNEEQKRDNDP